ncbi:MAG: tRNA lysidine(34) synthetase TilS [Christensenellales bacterium]
MDLLAIVKNVMDPLIGQDRSVVAAVSGGMDSMALLDVLLKLGVRIVAAHVHHGIRAHADDDERFVRKYCAQRGIAYRLSRVDVPAYAAHNKLGIEEAARILRHEALGRVMQQTEASRIALAHHLNDQCETIVFHFLRGSGLRGLCGMEQDDGVCIRPLLRISRQDIERYCTQHGIPFVQDETNDDPAYTRNRIRHVLLPGLETYNANLAATLSRNADVLRCEDDYLEQQAGELLRKAGCAEQDAYKLCYSTLGCAHTALARRVIRLCLRELGGLKDITAGHVDDVLSLRNGKLSLPNGIRAQSSGGYLWLGRQQPNPAEETRLILGGTTELARGRIIATYQAEAVIAKDASSLQQCFSADFPQAVVRVRRDGDYIRPLGMQGRKKLSDYLIDKKIPQWEKDALLCVCAGSEVLWVVGVGISQSVKYEGEQALVLRYEEGPVYAHTQQETNLPCGQ